MIKFEVGKTYETRSLCDYDCIFRIAIISRTEKTVTFEDRRGTHRKKLRVFDGVESFSKGNYSMAPIFSADQQEAK